MDNSDCGETKLKLPPEIANKIALIDQSLGYSLVGVIGVIISWYASYIKKQKLLCRVEENPCCDNLPKTYPIELFSNILIIVSVVCFFCLAKLIKDQPSTGCKDRQAKIMNYGSSFLVLIATVIRFLELILTGEELQPAEE